MKPEKAREPFLVSRYPFNDKQVRALDTMDLVEELWPMVYLLSSAKSKKAYVGESVNARSRLLNHLSDKEKKKLSRLHLITSRGFNKSVTLELEAGLIKYIAADEKFILQNGNAGLLRHTYHSQKTYTSLLAKVWEQLKHQGIAKHNLEDIDRTDLFKFSPYKSLTTDQYQSVENIIKTLNSGKKGPVFVSGGAGTGKTVLAIYLAKLLVTPQNELVETGDIEGDWVNFILELKKNYPAPKIALVVPMTPLRKTLKRNFSHIKGLSSKMVVGPAELAKKHNEEKYDILIVDEAHRLKQAKNLTNYGDFNRNNQLLGFGKDGNELDWILARSHNQIFFYDPGQTIRPTDVDETCFKPLLKRSPPILLTSQMRVLGGKDYIDYIDKLLDASLPEKTHGSFGDDYEFFLFDSLQQMIDRLKKKEKEVQLCRLVAGFSWKWLSNRNKKVFDIVGIEGIRLRWNSQPQDWINSENARNFKEAGSIHTTQGYDLNYTGVIFGKEICYDPEKKKIVVLKDNYYDKYGKIGVNDETLHKFIVNIYRTLMYRGIKGTYVYVCDDKLRHYFQQHIPSFGKNSSRIISLRKKGYSGESNLLDLSAEGDGEPE